MPRYIAFLRAINVGGARTVTMVSLRRAFEPLGLSSVTTFIASGNVLFETSARSTAALEALIGKRLKAALGYKVEAFVRSDRELARIAAYKAFPESEMGAGSELAIVFFATALDARTKQRLKVLSTETNAFRVHGREIYWLRRKGPGAVYSTIPLDKALDQPFTIRSSRTVKKLADKL